MTNELRQWNSKSIHIQSKFFTTDVKLQFNLPVGLSFFFQPSFYKIIGKYPVSSTHPSGKRFVSCVNYKRGKIVNRKKEGAFKFLWGSEERIFFFQQYIG